MKPSLRTAVFERDDYTCQYCGARPRLLTLYRAGKKHTTLHVDHMIPRAHGGRDDITNLVTACRGCNMAKGHRIWPFPLAYCFNCGQIERNPAATPSLDLGHPVLLCDTCERTIFPEKYPEVVDEIAEEVAQWDRLLQQEESGVF